LSKEALTARELEVLRMMSAGKSNKEIGAAFHITEGTVKVHMNHILRKLKVSSRTEAISQAIKRGLVPPGIVSLSWTRKSFSEPKNSLF
jgi:DNA-binding NarL/FixJ family response regulator